MAQFSQVFLQADIPFHLGNGQFRTFSKEELRDYVENSRRMMFDGGLGIHVKSEHPPPGTPEGGPTPFDELARQFSGPQAEQFADAIKTAGWVKDLHFDDATGKASVLFEVKSKPYIQAIREDRIRFSSPELREQYQDGLGREWGPTFAHFALTPKPRNPLQTVIKEVSSGHQQYAMQFSMADAVGIEPKDVPTLQFYDVGTSKELTSRKPRQFYGVSGGLGDSANKGRQVRDKRLIGKKNFGRNKGNLANIKPPPSYENANAATAEGKPMDNDAGPADQVDPAGQQPGLPRMKQPRGMAPGSKAYKKKYGTFGRRPKPGYGKQTGGGRYFQGSEQFDTNMMDMAPGYPPIPPIPSGPQSFDPSGLGGQTNMLGGLPVENPDVIQLPDDAKRQKSEAAVQLLDQIGISLAVGTDLTKLDDSALDSLLAALKTKIKANQEAEEAEMASMQDQQLKEQVPMIGQMSEYEADAVIGRTLTEIAQFSGLDERAARRDKRPERKPTLRKIQDEGEEDKRRDSIGRAEDVERARAGATYGTGEYRTRNLYSKMRGRPGPPKVIGEERYEVKRHDKGKRGHKIQSMGGLRKGDEQMSEESLSRRLASFKKRHDSQARQGLRKLIATSKLPPGMKAKLAGDVSGVQFAESGPELPTYTVQDVIELFNGSCPDGMQFGDRALVDAMEEPSHPKADRWGRRGAEANGMNQETAQFAADGVTMSKEDLVQYYDAKAKQPDWASRLTPTANGNGRTH